MADKIYNIELKTGLKADLPASDTHVGQPFFCTDTNELFIWDGTQMAQVSSSGSGVTLAQVRAIAAAMAVALG